MKITLCGSIKFVKEMREMKSLLEEQGHEILIPLSAELNQDKTFWNEIKINNIEEFASLKGGRMKGHFDKIKESDAILVLNYDKDGRINYIGPNTFLEMAIAFDCNKKIFVLNPLAENDPNFEELISMSPIIVNGDLSKIL